MSQFQVFETDQFLKDLDQHFCGQKVPIEQKLRNYVYPQLQSQPYFGKNIKKLRNYHPETWRYRIGNYRFFYEINDKAKILFMISVDSRQGAY